MPVHPLDVVNEARKWKGIPFKHQGRTKNGVDCVGLCLVVGWSLGVYSKDHKAYSIYPQKDLLKSHLDEILIECPKSDIETGCIVMMKIDIDPQHMAIVCPYSEKSFGMIHSYYKRGVVEHRLSQGWGRRIVTAYKIPGVVY